ncbi:MAG: DnaB-like helicase C-terminal domain-containing protein [Bacteroidota bacterium]|nr:DnaB-like helicase C-terminal domain-containing protein [Bacteroidota bacterium]
MNTEPKIDASHALIEKAILAAFIQNPELIAAHVLQVKLVYFHEPNYAIIYQMMYELLKQKSVVDKPILFHYLNLVQTEIDWQVEFGNMPHTQEAVSEIVYYIRKLEENFVNRQLVQIAGILGKTDTPISFRLNQSLQQLLTIKQELSAKQEVSLSELVQQFLQNDWAQNKSRQVKTGLNKLDALLGGGLDLKELLVVAGRPGMGKSALLFTICNHIIDAGKHKVLFVSLQLNQINFAAKLLANRFDYPLHKIKNSEFPAGYEKSCIDLLEAEEEGRFKFLYKTDTDFISLMADINTRKQRHGLDVVIIDSLQMLDEVNPLFFQNRHNTLGKNLRKLKQMAQENNFLLVLGSEVARSAERRFSVDNRPLLSDLKDSGAIEELADKVLTVYRPEYYHLEEWEDGEPTKDTGELLLIKNNMGNLGQVRVTYHTESHRYLDYQGYEAEEQIIHQFKDLIPPNRAHEFE